jgi:hypothetical protein
MNVSRSQGGSDDGSASSVIRAETWAELLEALFADSYDERLHRHRARVAYRGLSCCVYDLSTSLTRLEGDYARLEPHILRNFRKYAHRSAVESDTLWHWLALAQHHGLPTRLLDWTFSPLVALHFATANVQRFAEDGCVWAVSYGDAHAELPKPLADVLEREGSDVFTTEMLAEAVGSLQELGELSAEPFLLFFEPPALADRIINQYALFSVVSRADVRLDEWFRDHASGCRQIIIPAALKWEVRDKLDQANLTERVLMPGLDGLCRWLSRHYSPR